MPEMEADGAGETAWEITDLDTHHKSNSKGYRCVDGHRLSFRTRLCLAPCTFLGLALFSWLLLSSLHMPEASPLEPASSRLLSMPSHAAPSRSVQMVVVQNVIYLLEQAGLLSALWTRHK